MFTNFAINWGPHILDTSSSSYGTVTDQVILGAAEAGFCFGEAMHRDPQLYISVAYVQLTTHGCMVAECCIRADHHTV